jgi:FkbM family methyltransferase
MKQTRGGIYVPDDDWYFPMALDDNGRFEPENLQTALAFVPPDRRRVAVDGGAHVGTWTRVLAQTFDTVHAFEPHKGNFECLVANTQLLTNVRRYRVALGEKEGEHFLMGSGANTGCYYMIDPDPDRLEQGNTRVIPLPALQNVDFIKLDIEGYEYFALLGSRGIIERDHPVILIEEKKLAHAVLAGWPPARTLLEDMGYEEVARCRRDVVFTYKGD